MKKAWKICADSIHAAADQMKARWDKKASESPLQPGDTVKLSRFTHKVGSPSKFEPYWSGVYRLLERDSHHAIIQSVDRPDEKSKKVHLDQIKIFHRPPGQPIVTKKTLRMQKNIGMKINQRSRLQDQF